MRRSWDEPTDEGGAPDEPVTITERQLRSLKGGARAGMFALILAIAAMGLAGWNMFQASKQESEQSRPMASNASLAQASMTTPDGAQSASVAGAPTPVAGAPATQPVAAAAQTQASKPAPAVARTAKSSNALPPPPKRKSAAARATKPVTEAFEPAASTPGTPSPTPMPISIEPSKPVAQDSSGAHH